MLRAGPNLAVDHATRPADYPAWARAAYAAGVRLDLRYLCRVGLRTINASKIARVEELHAALDAGLAVGLVWQDTKSDALDGADGGRLDGIEAARQAAELGYPRSCIIFVAVDFRPTAGDQLRLVDDYFAAFRAACPWPIGVYGAGDVIDRLMYLGLAVAGWHVSAWGTTTGASLRQHGPYLTVGGVQCDPNDVLVDNLAVWNPGELMPDLADLLDRFGVPDLRDARVDGHGATNFVGVMVHHTAMAGAGLHTCQVGRPDLAGPIANINIARDGAVNVVTDGKAWHAGKGSSVVLADVKANRPVTLDAKARGLGDDTDGNPYFVGIEVDNRGDGVEAYPAVQIAALVAVGAALCDAFGWAPARVIHHRQWTARKPDMSYHGDLPALVAARLHPAPAPAPAPSEEDDMDRTAIPTWATRTAGRLPFYRLGADGAGVPLVLAYNGAPLNAAAWPAGSKADNVYGVPFRTLPGLAAQPVGIEEAPDGGIVVVCADGGTIDVARKP